ncbi:MAG: hypothetical protein Q8N01_07450 [Sulfuricurvum sp.]|nr:hypothetical protein [Sulfuricurvum sp.]MDP3021855.1 hypothetical protein [Sulfuricurvum sp.]MDP3120233.1 hypothetical protein [Sulfuricurvum sp.]
MSEQARILAEINAIIMNILKTGSASVEEADKIDELEALLQQQKCFKETTDGAHANQGEEIAILFFTDRYMEAINKMCECEISPDDFFAFVDYHYDEDHEDEALVEMFTNAFVADVNNAYRLKSKPE